MSHVICFANDPRYFPPGFLVAGRNTSYGMALLAHTILASLCLLGGVLMIIRVHRLYRSSTLVFKCIVFLCGDDSSINAEAVSFEKVLQFRIYRFSFQFPTILADRSFCPHLKIFPKLELGSNPDVFKKGVASEVKNLVCISCFPHSPFE